MKIKGGRIAATFCAVLLATGAAWMLFYRNSESPSCDPESETKEIRRGKPSSNTARRDGKRKLSGKEKSQIEEEKLGLPLKGISGESVSETNVAAAQSPVEVLTEDEQKLYDGIQVAMDSEKMEDVVKLCQKISYSSKRELREQAVLALGWFDGKTMAELTPFLGDPDEDIASDALFQWQEALTQIVSESERARLVVKAMNALTDENALEQISMELNSVDEKLAIEALKQIINSSNPACADKGKEAYEFITGEKYTNPAAADKWLKENYTPPEE